MKTLGWVNFCGCASLLAFASTGCGSAEPAEALGTQQAAATLKAQLSLQHPRCEATSNLCRTPVDNPTFAGTYSYGSDLGTQTIIDPPAYTLDKQELLFSEAVSMAGKSTFARSGELRPWPAPDAETPNAAGSGTFISQWSQHGARTGLGNLLVSATQNTNSSGAQFSKQLTDPTEYTLFPDTALVPVTAIIVVPAYASPVKAQMEALANQKYRLWDDVWSVDTTRSPATGVISSVQGNAKQVDYGRQPGAWLRAPAERWRLRATRRAFGAVRRPVPAGQRGGAADAAGGGIGPATLGTNGVPGRVSTALSLPALEPERL